MTRRYIPCAALAACAATLSSGIYSMNAQAPAHPWQAPAHGAAPAHQAHLLLTSELDGVYNKELRVLRTVYPLGAANTKHYHTSHVVFYILEGEGVWQGKARPQSPSRRATRCWSSPARSTRIGIRPPPCRWFSARW